MFVVCLFCGFGPLSGTPSFLLVVGLCLAGFRLGCDGQGWGFVAWCCLWYIVCSRGGFVGFVRASVGYWFCR